MLHLSLSVVETVTLKKEVVGIPDDLFVFESGSRLSAALSSLRSSEAEPR